MTGPHLILKTDRSELTLGVVEKPDWASKMGRDPFGLFVDATIPARKKSMFEVPFRMRWIPPGRFQMGSPKDEAGRYDDETSHLVTLTEGFWLAETPCTQAMWTAVVDKNPSRFVSPDRPVERVSYEAAQSFLQQFNRLAPGLALTLPTEAQWEYACRAGTETATYAGELVIEGLANAPVLDAIAWYRGNSGVDFELEQGVDSSDWKEKQYAHEQAGTRNVRTRAPNPWGLFDMLGNVYEWCEDWYSEYPDGAQQDPTGPATGDERVIRGGSWGDSRAVSAVRRYRRRELVPSGANRLLGFRFARGQAAPGGPEGQVRRAEPRGKPIRGADGSGPDKPAQNPTLFERARRWLSGKDDNNK